MTDAPHDDVRPARGSTIGEVAARAGISVRTLHHWDAVGLVRPSDRTPGGYRSYAAHDVARVHRVLVYRELGLPLADIGALLDADTGDPAAPLREQRAQLVARIERMQQMVGAVDRMIDAATSGVPLTAAEQVELLGPGWDPAWPAGARERWGGTAAWRQYAEQAAGRDRDGWQRVAQDARALDDDLAAAHRAGVRPGSPEAGDLAERHRDSLAEHFDCTHARHVCVARRYTTEPGFVAHYAALGPGLGAWLRDVVEANARAHGVDPATADWG